MASGGTVEHSREMLRQLSHQSSSDGGGESGMVGEELELLSNVYFEELKITASRGGNTVLEFHIAPHTADDKQKQYVYLDLTITLPSGYPNLRPVVEFNQSRGLSDTHLRSMSEGLQHKTADCLGSPMIYELVEYAKECLTDNNRPCGECAVCLCTFEDGDDFTRTDCYHYFHITCLATFVEFFNSQLLLEEEDERPMTASLNRKPKQLECPVCRENISAESACLEAVRVLPSVVYDDVMSFSFRPSAELRAWQAKMSSLLRKQQARGGVIDTSRRDDVIDENWVSTVRQKKKVNAQPDAIETSSDHRPVEQAQEIQTIAKETQTVAREKRPGNGVPSQQSNHKPRKPYYHSRGRYTNRHGDDIDSGRGCKDSETREVHRTNFKEKKNGYRSHASVGDCKGGEDHQGRKKEQTRTKSKTKSKEFNRHKEEGYREHRTEAVVSKQLTVSATTAVKPRNRTEAVACTVTATTVAKPGKVEESSSDSSRSHGEVKVPAV